MKKIFPTVLAASALALVASQGAMAAPYSVSGSGTSTNSDPALAYQNTTHVTTGSGDLAGNILTVDLVEDNNAGFLVIESTLVLDTSDGSGTNTITGCTDVISGFACSQIPLGSNPYQATSYGFVGSDFNWTLFAEVPTAFDPDTGAPTNILTIDNQYTASAVPVPAAAWLFGSALLGLAGVSRKRKA